MAKDLNKLRDKAVAATGKGKYQKAAGYYRELETLEPKDGDWPRKLGECFRYLDDTQEAVAAFTRSCERYANAGFFVKAIAVCKMILRLDSSHVVAQRLLVELDARRGITLQSPAPRTVALETVAVASDSPIGSQSLRDAVPGARQRSPRGVVEIPIHNSAQDDGDALQDSLTRTPLFSALSPASLRRLIDRVELVERKKGETVFRQGDKGAILYVIANGRVAIIDESTDSSSRTMLGQLGEGEFFGEISLLTDDPRTATVVAMVDCELLAIPRLVLNSLIREEPEVLTVLLGFLRDRLIGNLMRTNPLFAPFVGVEKQQLIRRFGCLEVETASVLVTEGTISPALYMVMTGIVRVERGGVEVARLSSGAVFGEMSLLSHKGAVASVVATRKCLVLELPGALFRELIMTHPQVLAYVAELARKREVGH